MGVKNNKIDNIEDLIAIAGNNLSILEEEVDVEVQKDYFTIAKSIGKQTAEYAELAKLYLENINDLFDEKIGTDIKKKMLIILATIDEVSVYRTIEKMSKQEGDLQKWATVALQQSRMLLQSTLLDDPGVFISTGLGGQGLLLRYFCVFFNHIPEPLQAFQQNIVRKETEIAVQAALGVFESIEFKNEYTSMLLLLPLHMDIQALFSELIDECNQYGDFLREKMIVTNVKKLSNEEIMALLHGEDQE